jgi:hypothetical protein
MNKFRKWINRDDGKYYQVGNESLNFLEILGGMLMICGFLLMVCMQKTDLKIPRWTVFTTFAFSVGLWGLGDFKKQREKRSNRPLDTDRG